MSDAQTESAENAEKKKRLHARSRMFFQKDLEEEVIRKLAERRGFLPLGLPCLLQLTYYAHEQVLFQHMADYGLVIAAFRR